MGSALARALVAGGHMVTAWNRTRARAEALGDVGVDVVTDLAAGVGDSEVTLMCVSDQAVCGALLSEQGVADGLRHKSLIQLTTGSPTDARDNARWAQEHDVAYLDGAIMAAPRDIGSADAVVLYSGSSRGFTAHEAMLSCLGQSRYLGDDPGRAAVMDAGLIALLYGTLAGLLHASTLVTAEGTELEAFMELAQPFFSTFVAAVVEETADRMKARRYDDTQASLNTHLAGIDLLVVGTSRDAGVNVEVMTAIRDSFARGVAAGRGEEDIAALLDVASG
jgi:3-hydroxyisobutyrate dehydrogenase-like beta-hydroxyacid dehydrogenase